MLHVLLALVLTAFLALQAGGLVSVLRARQARSGLRRVRRTELIWTGIPVAVVLLLAARSWIAVLDVDRPAIASPRPPAPVRAELTPPVLPSR
jgi:heme/copper-type cytochrome/quinol oxidase subunit 2